MNISHRTARVMEAPLQIVGCMVSSKPADSFIESFVARVRRERGVVTARSAQGATFVRFNAPDARLIALACEAALGPAGPTLRYGFAAGMKDRTLTRQDGLSVSNRSIAYARDLASVAREGEVLLTPQLAVLLIESRFTFEARQVLLPGDRKFIACALDLADFSAGAQTKPDAPSVEPAKAAALGSVFQALLAQAEEIARRQGEIEARQDAALGQTAPLGEHGEKSSAPTALEADLDAQMARLEERLTAIGKLEDRVGQIESRRKMVEEVQARANGIVNLLNDINANLEAVSEQRAVVEQVGDRLAQLDYTLQEAHNMLRALQREREVAERIEQGLKALRGHGVSGKSALQS
jgi:hypothetical protein